MHEHEIIEFESAAGRDDETIVRRLYSVEIPDVFKADRSKFFDIVELCSKKLGLSVFDIKIVGSAQTGYSFHSQKHFNPSTSDLDLAVINDRYFEKLLRAAQKVALPDPDSSERPRRNVFPEIRGNNTYSTFLENAALYGMILPHHMPNCDEKQELFRATHVLAGKYASLFKNVTVAVYLSQYFFERKQRPNLGIYRRARKGY